MSITTTVKVTGAGEFVSLVPALLGFTPRESVVVVPFKDGRTAGAIRIDLPPVEIAAEVARTVVGMVCKVEGATGLAAVVYGERDVTAAVGEQIVQQAQACGLALYDALFVTGEGWGHIGEDADPVALAPLPAHVAALVTQADQRAGAALPEVDPALAAEVAAAVPGTLSDDTDLIGLVEEALGWDAARLEVGQATALIRALNRPALRDLALIGWAQDTAVAGEALAAQIAWERGEEYPAHLAAFMWGEGPQPDAKRLTAALTLCRTLAALAPETTKTGPLATAGWLAWALGRSTHAEIYATEALRLTPDHGLAEIVTRMVLAGHVAEWAYRAR